MRGGRGEGGGGRGEAGVDRGDGASTVGAATVAATATRRRLCDCEQLQRWNRWRFFYRNRFTTIALLSFTAVVQLWLLSTSIVTKATRMEKDCIGVISGGKDGPQPIIIL